VQDIPAFIKMAKQSQKLIIYGFIYSIIFNIVGISFSVSAQLSPLVAAILMPSSSLGIMLIAYAGIKRITKSRKKKNKNFP